MPRSKDYVPMYRLHRQSGQAIVTLSYKDHLLGPYGTPESRALYHKLVSQWIEGGRQPLERVPARERRASPVVYTVRRLVADHAVHAERYYRHPDGRPTSEVDNMARAASVLVDLFGDVDVNAFAGPHLRLYIDRLIKLGRVRSAINRDASRVRGIFRWGLSHGLVKADVVTALEAVPNLAAGRSDALERAKVKPVDLATVEATKAFLKPIMQAAVDVQLLTGCRPGELLALRGADIDRSGPVWRAELDRHKTAHRGKTRVLLFGPKAQALLGPLLDAATDPNARLFNFPIQSYGRTIRRAAELADAQAKARALEAGQKLKPGVRLVPHWHPHQLRHARATELRARYGLESSRAALGHASLTATQVYAEIDEEKAARIAAEVG